MQGWDFAAFSRIARAAIALVLAASVAGCFQPLYSSRPAVGGPTVHAALRGVAVEPIKVAANTAEAPLAVQIRNNLLFDLNGGDPPAPSTHRLIIQLAGTNSIILIDPVSALPNVERYTLNATYSLTEIATNKVVVTGRALANVSYDTAGTQRFARVTGMQDAARRAAKVVSDQIRTRLASYFVAGS